MKVLVTGAEGKLGGAAQRALRAAGHEVAAPPEAELDVTRPAAIRDALSRHAAGAVWNCAAFTDVDGAEKRAEEAFRVNRDGAANVARACSGKGVWLVHLSTDFVFRGDGRRPCREEDPTGPESVYGRSKRAGEEAVLREHPAALVLRTAWLYGGRGTDFVRKVLERARRGGDLVVVEDQVGSPTWVEDLAGAMVALLGPRPRGILHFANAGECSRFAFAAAVLEEAGVPARIRPCRSSDLPGGAPRPAYAPLDTSRYEALLGAAPRGWREALRLAMAAEGG